LIVLRAFAALLSYPGEEMLRALPEIAEAVHSTSLVPARERDGVLALIDELAGIEPLAAEERYVALFDRGRAASLNLFEHLHGDGRERGDAMVELKRHYERAGFELSTKELPDFLPVLLEYLSCRDLREARDMLSDCAHILKSIATALIARGSAYAAIVQALIVIAGEHPVDAASVPRVRERAANPDRDWFEEPAFARAPLAVGSGRPRPETQ
jgi:nitrate reductase delta subunit